MNLNENYNEASNSFSRERCKHTNSVSVRCNNDHTHGVMAHRSKKCRAYSLNRNEKKAHNNGKNAETL